MPHTEYMSIKYSEITTLAPIHFGTCCGERPMLCPKCGFDLCVFCMDGCDMCDSEIDFSA